MLLRRERQAKNNVEELRSWEPCMVDCIFNVPVFSLVLVTTDIDMGIKVPHGQTKQYIIIYPGWRWSKVRHGP